jgi:hypothetical protein
VVKIPKGDRMGPWGQGSRTGRGLGFCSGYSSPGYTKGSGIGRGRGFGGGYGWRRRRGRYHRWLLPVPDYPPIISQVNPEDELQYLEDSKNILKEEIENIEKRIEILSKKDES